MVFCQLHLLITVVRLLMCILILLASLPAYTFLIILCKNKPKEKYNKNYRAQVVE